MHIHAPPGAEIRRARSLPAKLRPPRARLRTVSRHALVEDLRRAVSPLVVLCAPAGAGKTTLLRQWDYADERPFVWVRLDDADNDPVVLLLGAAARRCDRLPTPPSSSRSRWPSRRSASGYCPCLPRRSRPPLRSCSRSTMPTSSRETGRGASSRPCSAASRRGRSSRRVAGSDPDLPLARLRVSGEVVEMRAADLAFDRSEVGELLRLHGREPDDPSIDGLLVATEGWATGLQLGVVEQARAGRRPSGCASSPAGHARYPPPTWLPKSSPRSPESSRSSCCALPSSPS